MSYQKHNFISKQKLTAQAMNEIEDGIIALETNLKSDLLAFSNNISPANLVSEAESVTDKILNVRNADTFVMACVSDLHTSGRDTSALSALHAGLAINEIQSRTQLDLLAILGDIQVGDFEESTTESFKYVKKCFSNVTKSIPYLHLQGNHDELPSDTTEVAQRRYYAYIGANNVGTITDYNNKFRNYGYRDFENYKVRVIYLNTADVSEYEMNYDNNITAPQMIWFINTALNLSTKDDASDWGVIVCGHHPLNWEATGNKSVTKILNVLDAYKGRTSGSITIDGQSIAYDFSGETSEFICHIHGHLHNFREEALGTNKVLTITVPNACFERNNEYGNLYPDSPNVAIRYGDDGANNDGTGTQRTYTKKSDDANDTAFSVFCIDRESKIINIFNYGSGIDRKWNYQTSEKLEVSTDDDENNESTPTSISANYTGGEVVEGTALSNLTGLTVTAHYSDGSTANVTGYDLSGTIGVGNNTITVTYSGCTTIFIVTGYTNSEEPEEPSITNLILSSKDADLKNIYNDGKGYKEGYRLSGNNGKEEKTDRAENMFCTGYILYGRDGEGQKDIYLKNVTIGSDDDYVFSFDKNLEHWSSTKLVGRVQDCGNGVYKFTAPANNTTYIRICCGMTEEVPILTIGEEII